MVKEDKFDVAIVGAGPAGIMAAIIASELGHSVILIEKNKQLAKKLLLTGNGRCNLTNAEFNLRELVKNYGKNGEFLFHAFFVFGPKETINFFEKLGVKTKTEADKRVFPISDEADEILEALKEELEKNKVKILFNSKVIDVEKKSNKIDKIILESGEVKAKRYILATGGKSYTQTGSDGFGYNLAKKLGHTVVSPSPALCPIRLSTMTGKNLQGISLKNVRLNILQNGKKKISEAGEIMFTHFGISGPAILNISGKIGELLEAGKVIISLDLFPELNQEEVLKSFEEILQKYPRQIVKNILCKIAPERFVDVLLETARMDPMKIANNMSKIERASIVKILKNFEMIVEDIMGFDNAMVTRGGVSLEEIDHKTMKSKIINNLYFAGEMIDIDGKTGGFNLQACWSTGYLAGKNIKD